MIWCICTCRHQTESAARASSPSSLPSLTGSFTRARQKASKALGSCGHPASPPDLPLSTLRHDPSRPSQYGAAILPIMAAPLSRPSLPLVCGGDCAFGLAAVRGGRERHACVAEVGAAAAGDVESGHGSRGRAGTGAAGRHRAGAAGGSAEAAGECC